MTKAEAPQGFDRLVDEVMVQGLPVINSSNPNETALRFITALESGEITLTDVTRDGYYFPNYRKYNGIYPMSQVVHMVFDGASGSKKAGEFNGMFVAEQHRGAPHPSVLATSEEVKPYRAGII